MPQGRHLHRAALDQHQRAAMFGACSTMARSDHKGQRQRQEDQAGLQRRNLQPFCMNIVMTR
jgi:hypothetical protein